MTDWNDVLRQVETIARAAGTLLRTDDDALRAVNYEDQADVKLRADVDSEELIRARLGAAFPWPVIGEEAGGDATLAHGGNPYWVVDPLDGTHNYLRGVPHCAVSIGLLRGEEPVLGVIYDFNNGECFSACAAGPLRINGAPARPRWAATIDQASIATGFPSAMERSPARVQELLSLLAPFKKARMLGSAALAMAYVAAGRYDVYHEESVRLWDVAAGLALVRASGGVTRLAPSRDGITLAYDIWVAGRPEFIPAG
jgi:myo-inositol-1(or 4)-monophosphatase